MRPEQYTPVVVEGTSRAVSSQGDGQTTCYLRTFWAGLRSLSRQLLPGHPRPISKGGNLTATYSSFGVVYRSSVFSFYFLFFHGIPLSPLSSAPGRAFTAPLLYPLCPFPPSNPKARRKLSG